MERQLQRHDHRRAVRRCLDVWSTANGAQVQIYDCSGQANQQFKLNPL